jgi:hypothetical protein
MRESYLCGQMKMADMVSRSGLFCALLQGTEDV